MPHIQHATGRKQVPKACNERGFGRFVEIDHGIPAKDRVEWTFDWPRVDKIELAKRDKAFDVLDDHLGVRPASNKELSPQSLR